VALWCLPALIAGWRCGLWLTARMPWGYVQYDSSEYLATAYRLLKSGAFSWMETGVPGAGVVQHSLPAASACADCDSAGAALAGAGGHGMSGALARLWFARWRWFIVPVTLFVALNR